MPVLVIRISDVDGREVLANTVTTFTGETFFELFEKCVISKRITSIEDKNQQLLYIVRWILYLSLETTDFLK